MRSTPTPLSSLGIDERLERIAHASGSKIGSLCERRVEVRCSALEVRSGEELLGRIAQPLVLLRQRLTGAHGELTWLVGRRGAVTLGCLARPGLTDQDILERRLAPMPDAADLQGLHDVACALAERGDRAFRGLTADRIGLALTDVVPLTPETAADLLATTGQQGVMRVRIVVDGIPPTDLTLLVDSHTLELLRAEDPSTFPQVEVASDDGESTEPPVTSCGLVHAFLIDEASIDVARRCAAKLGLDFDARPGMTAPNPSVIQHGLVLLDCPNGFDRRFDWCLRLKQARPDVLVALLVHQPTRTRVIRGFAARADAVIAWPIDAIDLGIRLRRLLSGRESRPGS